MTTAKEIVERHGRRTGEARKVRQPLGIDRLPLAIQDRIRAARIAGRTWMEIEQQSPKWAEWAEATEEQRAIFPDLRLPHTNLHRWYDLRVEQVIQEQEQRAQAAHAAAEKLAARGFSNLTASVKHALGEAVFELMNANAAAPDEIVEALTDVGHLLVKVDRNDLKREEIEQEKQKIELLSQKLQMMKGSVKGLKEAVEKKEVTPEQLQQKLDEIYGL
jgi:hypothetical protein